MQKTRVRLIGKLSDSMTFLFFIAMGTIYYQQSPYVFDMLIILSLFYTVIRRPDINTASLALIVLISDIIPSVVIFISDSLNGYLLHFGLLLVHLLTAIIVFSRPFILLRAGPKVIRMNSNIAPTNQDTIMGYLYAFQTLWQLTNLIEHIIRNVSSLNPMYFYDTYKTGQFGFSILTILVLYFMTFDASKLNRNLKA